MKTIDKEIKQTIIEGLDVYDIYGSSIKRVSQGWKAVCSLPKHTEKTASFHIYDNLSFNCFGCNTGGDVFKFIMLRDSLSFPDAVNYLANMAGVDISNDRIVRKYEFIYEINKYVTEFYQAQLAKTPVALDYLHTTRGYTDDTIKKFKLGYANTSINKLLLEKFRLEDLLLAGVVKKKDSNEIRDFFYKRIMFPIIAGNGDILGFSGRSIDYTKESLYPKYLNSPETPIFKKKKALYGLNVAAIRTMGFANIVEGNPDVCMCDQNGYPNTVAPLGTALTPYHIEILRKYCPYSYLVFDGDAAGDNASLKSVRLLYDSWMGGAIITMPEGHDPDSYIREGNDFGAMFADAMPYGAYLAEKFPGLRSMIYRQLLKRNHFEAAEFLSHIGSSKEMKMFEDLSARKAIISILEDVATIYEKNSITIKKFNGYLYLFMDKRFLVHAKLEEDPIDQSKKMINKIIYNQQPQAAA